MSVQSVSGSDANSLALWLESIGSTNRTTGGASSAQSTAAGDSSSISTMSQLFSQLDSLATSDPARFKQLTGELASELTSAANDAAGNKAEALKWMAAQFSKASESGKAEDLRPPTSNGTGRAHHGHHAHQKTDADTNDSAKTAGDVLRQLLQEALGTSSATAISGASTSGTSTQA